MFLIVCLVVLSSIFLIKFLSSPTKSKSVGRKSLFDIPCPGSLPIFGNITDLFCSNDELWKRNTERAVKYYPLYRLKQFNKNVVFLLQPEDLEMILDNSKLTIKGPIYNTLRKWTGNGLVVSDGSFWQKRRKLLTKGFHFAVLREYMKIFYKNIDSVIDGLKIQTSKPVEVLSPLKHMTIKVINEIIFGDKFEINKEDLEIYGDSIETMTKIISHNSMRPYDFLYNFTNMKKKEEEALRNINNFTDKLLKNHNNTSIDENVGKYKKILDIMLKVPDVFDDEGIFDEINTLNFGGHDTTSSGLTFVLLALANYPEYQEMLYQEIVGISGKDDPATHAEIKDMNFLDRFLKECLRLLPPVTFLGRELIENIVTKTGYELPAGTLIIIDIFNIHRNPQIFSEPETFNPDRFLLDNVVERHPYAYIPFSAGPRNCIAQRFAMLEMKTSICAILKKFILKPGDLIENIEFIPDPILQTKNKIKVKFELRT